MYFNSDNYQANANVTTANEIACLPNVKNIHINGHATRFVYHVPKYAYGHFIGIPIRSTLTSSLFWSGVDTVSLPENLNFYWLDIGDYSYSATASQGATIRLELRCAMVCEMKGQVVFLGQ